MERMSFGIIIVCLLVDLYCDDCVDYSYLIGGINSDKHSGASLFMIL